MEIYRGKNGRRIPRKNIQENEVENEEYMDRQTDRQNDRHTDTGRIYVRCKRAPRMRKTWTD